MTAFDGDSVGSRSMRIKISTFFKVIEIGAIREISL